MSSKSFKEIKALCKEKKIVIGKKNEAQLRVELENWQPPAPPVDTYTAEVLKERFLQHKEYVLGIMAVKEKTGLSSIRLPNPPEDISENMVKFIIHKRGDKSSKWTKAIASKGQKITGDLISEKEGTQECKCFTSDGPASFGPKEAWDVIYFLDATKWLENKFELWRVPLSNTSKEWKAIKMNKNEDYEMQANQGRRPRSSWEGPKGLHAQLGAVCEKIYEGTFEDIFT